NKVRQQLDWKNLVADVDGFRAGLLSALGVSREEWDDYGEEVRNYRDWVAAHHDLNHLQEVPTWPQLDRALAASYFYYNWLCRELAQHGVQQQPRDIERYCCAFVEQARHVARAALAATRDLAEEVG